MLRIFLEFFVSTITIISGVATLWAMGKEYFPFLKEDGRVAIYFIGIFAVIFFIESCVMKIKWGRARLYAECLPVLNRAFSDIHKTLRVAENNELKSIDAVAGSSSCNELCERLAESFTIITGAKCAVTIRCLEKREDGLVSFAFARSAYQKERRRYNDRKNEIDHLITENSDFLEILENIEKIIGRYFICNNLPSRLGYKNTSFKTYGKPSRVPIIRFFKWPLPYRSTVVVPICPDIADQRNFENLAGFLCVDSSKALVFKKNYDTDLMIGVADGLYDLMRKIKMSED
jgi:hypothetical protein